VASKNGRAAGNGHRTGDGKVRVAIIGVGKAFVNAIPVFIGREPYWQRRFAEDGLPIIGDDIKSQVGATITHRVLTRPFMDRGVKIDRTSQLNFGGNTDFLNMLERERLESKKVNKTNAVTSMMDYEIADGDIHVGPSDYVPWLKDRGAERVLHEVAADADPRRHRSQSGRGLHPRRRQRDARRHREGLQTDDEEGLRDDHEGEGEGRSGRSRVGSVRGCDRGHRTARAEA